MNRTIATNTIMTASNTKTAITTPMTKELEPLLVLSFGEDLESVTSCGIRERGVGSGVVRPPSVYDWPMQIVPEIHFLCDSVKILIIITY